jgi:1-acyl-sn-glycerol-3-phosphate acyltransferase
LNSGAYWPRRSLLRRPGTIVVEFLDPLPPGLARAVLRERVETAIESASTRLQEEAKSEHRRIPA